MTTGNNNGHIAFESMYHYALQSKMYNVQPSHFVFAMETFMLLWITGFMAYPYVVRGVRKVLNIRY